MNDMAGVAAIVVGAGSGSRMGADKAFLDLAGKPVIAWPVDVLQGNMLVSEIVLVLHQNRLEEGRSLAEKRGWTKVRRSVPAATCGRIRLGMVWPVSVIANSC